MDVQVLATSKNDLQQPCTAIEFSIENLLEAMDDKDEWRERERERARESRKYVLAAWLDDE